MTFGNTLRSRPREAKVDFKSWKRQLPSLAFFTMFFSPEVKFFSWERSGIRTKSYNEAVK